MAPGSSRGSKTGECKMVYRFSTTTSNFCPDYQWTPCRYQDVLRIPEGRRRDKGG